MKKLLTVITILLITKNSICQQLKFELLGTSAELKQSDNNDTLIVQQGAKDIEVKLKMKIADVKKDVAVTVNDLQHNTAVITTDYNYDVTLPNVYNFTEDNKMEGIIKVTIKTTAVINKEAFGELDFDWDSVTEDDKSLKKTLVIKIISKTVTAPPVTLSEKGWIADKGNYLKAEIVQYTDITGIKNDKPNGLLQFQGIIKIATNRKKWVTKNGWSLQPFRSFLIDATINRIDKSKEEVDYNYTAFLYESDKAKKTYNPWLATTDIWRYSNFHGGARIVPLALEKGNFRIQFQAGAKLLKNLPYSQDTIRSGVDSGKVKSDFRSVYSVVKYVELFIKTIETDNKVTASLNTGFMWLKLLDSYYEQIDIYQQDPFQKTIALSPVSKYRKSPPMWFASLRVGIALGEEKVVNTFVRLNYTLQKGTYLKPLVLLQMADQLYLKKSNFLIISSRYTWVLHLS